MKPELAANGRAAASEGLVPPHDMDAEMACLGSMLMDRHVVGEVLRIIPKSDSAWFYHPSHQKLYEILVDLYDANQPIDLILVSEHLRLSGLLEEVGGPDYLIRLAESFSDIAHAEYYAAAVRDKGMLRELIRAAAQVMESAYRSQEPAPDILEEAERKLFKVTERRINAQALPLEFLLRDLSRRIELRDGGLLTGLATGFTKLDELTSGFQRGDFIVVAGRPSMGKTALGLTIAEHMAVRDGRPVVFFSLEMSGEQVAQRLLCGYHRFDSHNLRRRFISEAEMPRLLQSCAELSKAPLFIDDTPGMSILELRSKARRMKLQHDVQAVFVDYMQLMHAGERVDSRQIEVANISRGLKSLGRELGVPVIVMAQLNRMAEERHGNRPRMSDLRESGAIEQDADVILLIHREEYYKTHDQVDDSIRGLAEIIIAKQRNGPTDTVKLQYNAKYTRFDNRTLIGEAPDEANW